jgi:hypothetical protein
LLGAAAEKLQGVGIQDGHGRDYIRLRVTGMIYQAEGPEKPVEFYTNNQLLDSATAFG